MVSISASEPIGSPRPRFTSSTPAIRVEATAPSPTVSTPRRPSAGRTVGEGGVVTVAEAIRAPGSLRSPAELAPPLRSSARRAQAGATPCSGLAALACRARSPASLLRSPCSGGRDAVLRARCARLPSSLPRLAPPLAVLRRARRRAPGSLRSPAELAPPLRSSARRAQAGATPPARTVGGVTAIVMDGKVLRDELLEGLRKRVEAAGSPPICL